MTISRVKAENLTDHMRCVYMHICIYTYTKSSIRSSKYVYVMLYLYIRNLIHVNINVIVFLSCNFPFIVLFHLFRNHLKSHFIILIVLKV